MDIRDSIAGIVAKSSLEKRFSGTGFFVSGGLILTCAHVVNQAHISDGKVQFRIEGKKQFHDAVIYFKSDETKLDICVLKPVDFEEEVPPLKLVMSRQSEGNTFKTFGYPQPTGFQGLRGDGEILGWVRDTQGRDALHISSDEVTHGYSGCPIWDNEAGGVVGMLSRGFDFGLDKKLGSAVFAIPSEVLKDVYPELLVDETPTPEPIPTWNLIHPYPMPPNFTGRLAERKMLVDWLQNDAENRLFILRALGGFGKSALSWHWLTHDVNPKDWPKVVWWSFYEGDASFENLIKETLEYLNVEVPPGQRQQVDALLKAMSTRKILLIMDGFERALRAYSNMNAAYQEDKEIEEETSQRDCVNLNAEIFLKNLCTLPNIKSKVLMSTRLTPRAIEQRGELLGGCHEVELQAMQKEDAVTFFRAQGIRGTRAEIEAVCAPYGYHPLSLRILAGLISNDRETPGDITVAGKLDIVCDVIQNKHHVLEVAYNTLSPEQQKLLSQIACFRSAMTYDALNSISDENIDADLKTLEHRGLLHWDKPFNKYDLHPIVRRYSYSRLTALNRIAFHATLRNYYNSIDTYIRPKRFDELTPVIELYHHTVFAGEFNDAKKIFEYRLKNILYFQFGAYQLIIDMLQALFSIENKLHPTLADVNSQAFIYSELANAYGASGQPQRAELFYEKYNSLYEEVDRKDLLASGLGEMLSTVLISIGSLRKAETHLIRSIALCREIQDHWIEAISSLQLGLLLIFRGMWSEAKEKLDLSIKQAESKNHFQMQSVVWAYQSFLAILRLRDPTQLKYLKQNDAHEFAYKAYTLVMGGDPNISGAIIIRDLIRTLWLLGTANRIDHNLETAESYLNDALNRCRALNIVESEAGILLDLANVRYEQNNVKEAKKLAEESLQITKRCGYVLQGADVHLFLAQYALEQEKDKEKAKELAERAKELATCDGPPYYYKVAYEEAERMLEKLSVG